MRVLASLSDAGIGRWINRSGLILLLAGLPVPGITASQAIFPDPAKATLKQGLFVPTANIRLIMSGMTKPQIRALLGPPHFHEGFFGVRSWNYILNFPIGTGSEYRICQFQLNFDRKMRVVSTAWRSNDCAQITVENSTQPGAEKVAGAGVRQERLSIQFEFGSATLSPGALALLRDFAGSHDRSARLEILGHTDRAGSSAYNDVLSLARADAVAGALADLGVPSDHLTISGRGERDPVIGTQDGVREPVNRRSDVVVSHW